MTSQQKFDELLLLLAKGSCSLVLAKEFGSAIDLAELFADTLVASQTPLSTQILDEIEKLVSMLPAYLASDSGIKESHDRRNKFISTIVKWSQNVSSSRGDRKRGSPLVHYRFATVLWKEKKYQGARKHFLLADEPEKFAQFLIEMHTSCGYNSEADLFVALSAFQLMCLRRVRVASTLLSAYAAAHPQIAKTSTPYEHPLLNFVNLLCQTIPKKNLTQFSILVDKYRPIISRDESFKAYLDKIGQMYFGVPAPNKGNGMGGMLGNIFRGLMGDNADKKSADSESDEFEGEPMEEDGYDTAPEDEAPRSTEVAATHTQVEDNFDDLD